MKQPRRFYNQVDRGLCRESRFRALPPDSRNTLRCFLLAAETTLLPGLVVMHREAVERDVGLTSAELDAAMVALEAAGYCRADWEAPLIWLRDALTHNNPLSPTVVCGWRNHWHLVPECPLRDEAAAFLRSQIATRGEVWAREFDAVVGPSPLPYEVPSPVGSPVGSPIPGSGSGFRFSGTETETGEGECVGSASPKKSENPPTPSFSTQGKKETEKPARVAMPVKAPMPEGWTLSAEYIARLEVTYHRRDIEAQIPRFRRKAKSGAWVSADWSERFVDFLAQEVEWGKLAEKPKQATAKPRGPDSRGGRFATSGPAAEPAKPEPTTPDQDRAALATWDARIATAEADPALAWNLETMIAARAKLVEKMAADAARHAEAAAILGPEDDADVAARAPGSAMYLPPVGCAQEADNDESESA